ncbi:MAG TPA: D-arabinono-1,4-lactone oxidase, partial [Solirubrobacteraceae bacterium]
MSEPSDSNPRTQWRNWAGDERCVPATVEQPGSLEELARAIVRAGEAGQRVRVAGAGHSFSDIACTDGMLVRLDRMARVLDVDRSSGLVRVQAGITIHALNQHLAEHGLAMENLGDIDVQSIAGAISTATHGTGARLRNIPSQVRALTLVLADGSTLECSAQSDPELFRAARVGLGALGAVAEVTLSCVPAFVLEGLDRSAPLLETLERFEELALGNDHFEFFVFPHTETALTRTNNRTDKAARSRSRLSAYANDVLLTNHAFGAFCALGRLLPAQIPHINRAVTSLAGSSRRVERSDRIFASPRLVRFTEMEYSLPRERTPEAVRRVLQLVKDRGFAVPFPVEVR